MRRRWLSLGELLKRQVDGEARELSDREAVLEVMAGVPDPRGPTRAEPDPSEFEDHGADDWRRPEGWDPDA